MKVSIIVRTKNEQLYLNALRDALSRQSFQDFEVVCVDNLSDDGSAEQLRSFGWQVVEIDKYLPGKALNTGYAAAQGRYCVNLSAHCIPVDEHWLAEFVEDIEASGAAGCYGRQVPTRFTPPDDARDLLYMFPSGTQNVAHHFFHNANSIIDRQVWEVHPFDAEVRHVEDLVWARTVADQGLSTHYTARSAVFHHHGVNQHGLRNESFRSRALVETLRSRGLVDAPNFEPIPYFADGPQVLVLTAAAQDATTRARIDELSAQTGFAFAERAGDSVTFRGQSTQISPDMSFAAFLAETLTFCEGVTESFFDAVVFFDQFDGDTYTDLLSRFRELNYHSVITAKRDTGNYWTSVDNVLSPLQSRYDDVASKKFFYRESIGHGSIFSASVVRSRCLEKTPRMLLDHETREGMLLCGS